MKARVWRPNAAPRWSWLAQFWHEGMYESNPDDPEFDPDYSEEWFDTHAEALAYALNVAGLTPKENPHA